MFFNELHNYLSENTLNRYNLFRCYSSVYDINEALLSVGLEELMFPITEYLGMAFDMKPKRGEEFFSVILENMSEPHYDEIEKIWFRHCDSLSKFKKEVLS